MTPFYKTCIVYLAILLIPFQFSAANYYWVGGSGNWSDINHWATASGGSTLHSFVPSQNDNVFFDAGSGFTTSSRLVSVNTNATCNNMTWLGAGNTPTLYANGFNLNIFGSLQLQTGMVYDVQQTFFASVSAGQTISVSSATLIPIFGSFTFNGTGSWTLLNPVNAPNLTMYVNSGNLNTNSQSLSINSMSSNTSLTCTLSLGSSTVTTNGSIGWTCNNTNMTVNGGSSTIILNYPDPGVIWNIFSGNPISSYGNVIFNYGGRIATGTTAAINSVLFKGNADIYGNNTFNTVTFSAGKNYRLTNNNTTTITGQLNANPGICGGWITLSTNNPSLQNTISMPATAVVNASNMIIDNVKAIGGASFIATNSSDDGNNIGWTFTAPSVNSLYWIGGTGNWSDGNHWSVTSNGAASGCVPGPGTDVFFDAGSNLLSGTETVSITSVGSCRNLNCSGSPAAPKLISSSEFTGSLNIYGSVTLQSGMTYSVPCNYRATGAATILSNGVAHNFITKFNGTGTWLFQDPFNCTANVELAQGTINTNNQPVAIGGTFTGVGGFTKNLLLGSSIITFAGGTWNYTGGSLNAGTSHIIFTNGGTLIGGPHTYYNVTFNNSAAINSTGNTNFNNVLFLKDGTLYSASKFNQLTFSPNSTYNLQSLRTQTVTGQFNASSPACGGWITLTSSTIGSQASLFVPSSGVVNVSQTIMQDINGLGGATFNAVNSLDNSNNTGWVFGANTNGVLYWVGGTGDWGDANHWSTINNGIYPSTSPCIPGPGDDVFFNANSGLIAASKTVSISASAYCHNITCAGSATPPSILGASNSGFLNVFGSMVLQNGGVYKTEIIFKSNNAETITTNGAQLTASGSSWTYVKFDGKGSWTLQDDFDASPLTFWFNQGTINTNNKKVTFRFFGDKHYAGIQPPNTVGVRHLALGSSTLIATNGAVNWYYDQPNSTLDAGTSLIILNAQSDFRTKAGDNYYDVTFKSVADIQGTGSNFHNVICQQNTTIHGAHKFNNLTFNGGSVYNLESTYTQTVTSNFYPSGNPCFITYLKSTSTGSRGNLMVGAGNVNYDYLSVQDIDASTSYTLLNVAGHGTNAGNNINWSFAPTTTVGIVGLGPDLTRCQSQLPLVLKTTDFYPNPLTQFSWTGGTTADTLVVTSGGSYNVNVNYGTGCNISDNIVITSNPTPTLSVTGNTSICNGAGTILTANGASTYTWTSPAVTTNTVFVNPPSNTTYTLSGNSAVNCPGVPTMVTVSINAAPTVGIASVSSNSICPGNTTIITPNGASTYTLIPGNLVGSSFNVSPSVTTTYTISGTSSAGCISTAGANPTTMITVNNTPTVGVASVSNATICSGNNTIITPSGASTYTLIPGNVVGTSFNVSPTVSTTYTISGTSSAGCISTAGANPTTAITVNNTPTVGIASVSNATICSGNNTLITPSGASSYTLMPGNVVGTSFNVSPAVSTTYTISGASTAGCISTAGTNPTTAITVNNTPTLGIASVSNATICSGNNTLITPNGASSYTLMPGNVVGTSFNVSPAVSTTYTISGTSTSGCISTAGTNPTTAITVNNTPTVGVASVSNATICSGNNTVITPNGASSYTLMPGNIVGTSFNVSPAVSTTYTISGTNASGCISTAGTNPTTAITVNNTPTVGIASVSNATICSGNNTLITPNGASSYTLMPGNVVGTSFNVSPAVSTTYTISGTSASGCISNAGNNPTTIITVNNTPTLGIASVSNATICSGNNTVITPNGASSYTLMPGSLVGTSFNVSPAISTTYTISGTSIAGCISTAATNPTTTIIVNATPTIGITSASSSSICSGNNSVIMPSGASSYTLTPGNLVGTSFTVSPAASTTYTINGSSAAGCISTAASANHVTITVNALPSLAVSSLTNVSCFGMANGAVVLTPSGGAGAGYTITPNTFTNLTPANYTYTVTDANLCVNSVSFAVTEPSAALAASAAQTASNTSCISANGTASVSINGGTPTYTVNWSNGSVGDVVTNLNTGTHTYTVTDVNGCSLTTGTLALSGVTGINTAAASQSSVNCFGAQTGALTYTTTGGSAYSYTLIPTATPSASLINTSGTFSGLGAGSYSLMVIDLGSGCRDMLVNTITQPTSSVTVSAVTTNSVLCYNATGSVSLTPVGGTGSYTYNWEANSSTTNTATYSAGSYTAMVSDANGCVAPAVSFTVAQPAAPLSASVTTFANNSCTSPNGSFTVTANGGTPSYSFAINGNTLVAGNVFSGLTTGNQSLTVMDANNCSYSVNINISGIPSPVIAGSSVSGVSCFGQSNGTASLTLNGGTLPYSYSWSNGASTPSLTGLPAGVYTATVTDNGNCTVVTSVTISGPTAITATASDIVSACPDKANGQAAVVVSGGTPAYTITWSNGTSGNMIMDVLPANYTVTITDANSCVTAIGVTIPALSASDAQCDDLLIPQMVTPNGDGKNDLFVIRKIEAYPNNTLSIFNRWGSLVYSKKGYKNEWNGVANVGDGTGNSILPTGTYFIVLDFGDQNTKPYHGYVELKY